MNQRAIKTLQTTRQIDISRNLNTPSYLQIRMYLNRHLQINYQILMSKTQQSDVILIVKNINEVKIIK
jgi:hypothetical protein